MIVKKLTTSRLLNDVQQCTPQWGVQATERSCASKMVEFHSDKFQFIKNSACPAVSFTAGQVLSSYTVCFPGARVNLRPSGRVTSAVRLAGISNS